jgi:hypothetical protein
MEIEKVIQEVQESHNKLGDYFKILTKTLADLTKIENYQKSTIADLEEKIKVQKQTIDRHNFNLIKNPSDKSSITQSNNFMNLSILDEEDPKISNQMSQKVHDQIQRLVSIEHFNTISSQNLKSDILEEQNQKILKDLNPISKVEYKTLQNPLDLKRKNQTNECTTKKLKVQQKLESFYPIQNLKPIQPDTTKFAATQLKLIKKNFKNENRDCGLVNIIIDSEGFRILNKKKGLTDSPDLKAHKSTIIKLDKKLSLEDSVRKKSIECIQCELLRQNFGKEMRLEELKLMCTNHSSSTWISSLVDDLDYK